MLKKADLNILVKIIIVIVAVILILFVLTMVGKWSNKMFYQVLQIMP